MEWLIVAVLGGIVGLDTTAFGQFMFSRPLVAASLTGLLMGDPVAGVQIGILVEAFSLVALPVGAARYPEGGTAAVATAAGFVASDGSPAALLVALAFGVLWEQVMGTSVLLQRRVNAWLVAGEGAIRTGADIDRRHLAAMGFDFARAASMTLLGGLAATALVRILAPFWDPGSGVPLGLVTVAAAAMLAAMLSIFGGWSERRVPFVAGLALGGMLWLLR